LTQNTPKPYYDKIANLPEKYPVLVVRADAC
jgi:hypothetical protein